MIDLDDILQYVPSQHGEHGVDSVIHRLCNKNNSMHESYCNPPGASWAEIRIKHPSGKLYHWDHIPRAPEKAKRPDSIIQYNENNEIHLLSIESKEKITDAYPDMNELLKNFFTGSKKFDGLFNRPAWHYNTANSTPSYIQNSKEQYWLKDYKQRFVYSGFAFSFEPEYYADISNFDDSKWNKMMVEKIKHIDLGVIIGVGWHGINHLPFTRIVANDKFAVTNFYKILNSTLLI